MLFSDLSVSWLLTRSNRSTDYTEGAELVESVLDVVRKEAEGTDCLQGDFFGMNDL